MRETDDQNPLKSLLDGAVQAADGDKLKLGDILDAFGTRSFGPVIAVLAMISISPIGAIPFLPMLFAALILLIAVQLPFGRKRPWIPEIMRDIGFKREKVERFRRTSAKWLDRIDRLFKPRWSWAAGQAAQYLAAIAVALLAIIMAAPPLEAIPYATSIPASAILMFGLGLTARDGLWMLVGFIMTLVALVVSYSWIFSSSASG